LARLTGALKSSLEDIESKGNQDIFSGWTKAIGQKALRRSPSRPEMPLLKGNIGQLYIR
jgi:hypothetical protein